MPTGFPESVKCTMDCTCYSCSAPYQALAFPSHTSGHLRTKIHFPDLHARDNEQGSMLVICQNPRHVFLGNYSFKQQLKSRISPTVCCRPGFINIPPASKILHESVTPLYLRTFAAQRMDIPPSIGRERNDDISSAFPMPGPTPSSWSSDESNQRREWLSGKNQSPHPEFNSTNRRRRFSPHQNAWGGPTYTELITKAILSTAEQRMTLASIYDWISDHVPYFGERKECKTSKGWKNTIRHTLSLRKRFIRFPKTNDGTTSWYCSWWTFSDQYLAKQSTLLKLALQTRISDKVLMKKRRKISEKAIR